MGKEADVANTSGKQSSGTELDLPIGERAKRRLSESAAKPLLIITRRRADAFELNGTESHIFQAPATAPQTPKSVATLAAARPGDAVAADTRVEALGGLPKRMMDLLIAMSAIIALSPLFLAVAVAIRLSMGGPVFFSHQRVGLGGREFPCYKFRTMVNNGDEVLARHLEANSQCAREWSERQKLVNDPRVPRLGRFLRKTSIDELPQLFNVLANQMSCIGPRPVTREELQRYGSNVHEYQQTRPGMTGLWQVSGRNTLSYDDRVRLDTRYVRTWSMLQDLWILILTIRVVFQLQQTS